MDTTLLGAGPSDVGQYVDWGVIQISVTNLAIIAAMLLIFALALVVPFGRAGRGRDGRR